MFILRIGVKINKPIHSILSQWIESPLIKLIKNGLNKISIWSNLWSVSSEIRIILLRNKLCPIGFSIIFLRSIFCSTRFHIIFDTVKCVTSKRLFLMLFKTVHAITRCVCSDNSILIYSNESTKERVNVSTINCLDYDLGHRRVITLVSFAIIYTDFIAFRFSA